MKLKGSPLICERLLGTVNEENKVKKGNKDAVDGSWSERMIQVRLERASFLGLFGDHVPGRSHWTTGVWLLLLCRLQNLQEQKSTRHIKQELEEKQTREWINMSITGPASGPHVLVSHRFLIMSSFWNGYGHLACIKTITAKYHVWKINSVQI